MGCATSKPKHKVCRNCHTPYSPVRRSYSLHGNRHPKFEEDDDDGCHVVALTSSTLGSLKLDLLDQNHRIKEEAFPTHNKADNAASKLSKEEFAKGVVEAMSWSKMIDEKIPKVIPRTPIRTPPGEPETINAWELMEGLEDSSPLRPPHHHGRSFSFNLASNRIQSLVDQSTPRVRDDDAERQNPIWEEAGGDGDGDGDDASNSNSNDTSIVSDFDPEVISTFRKALEELPPANPFHLKPLQLSEKEKKQAWDGNNNDDDTLGEYKSGRARGKEKLIVYFTSLRGVRKTYEDCCNVRVILKALGVKIDERDVSMHSGFKEELKELLGEGWHNGGALPKVFIGGKYIGGAEEISRMHEHGQLEKFVEGCELVEDSSRGRGSGGGGGGINGVTCEACGDIRFVPCDTCSGSCKIYSEGDYDEEEQVEESDNGFQRCPDCNENGLIRCPICCD